LVDTPGFNHPTKADGDVLRGIIDWLKNEYVLSRDIEAMSQLIVHAHEQAPIGGIFLMTVVSRDGLFSGMKQE
jgi:hypothetical protein